MAIFPSPIRTEGEIHYVLYDANEPVVTAQATWKRLAYFDLVVESGEGAHQVHIDTMDWHRRSVAWKTGEPTSLAGFVLESEGSFSVKGWITTASGRSFALAPTSASGFEYVVFPPGGRRLITVFPLIKGIGGNPGYMLIAPEAASDPELPALVGLSFALACEQVMLVHRSGPRFPPSL